ncbi:unnamed protein product [Effrenium voratum]|uniref:Uncharacterized protein n=1 Tax=Effrenium voratum TaxID=2562239 RepID=A0AA36MQP9_9DINO|nr:unnamed protein product [Effrenium voratum]
MAPKSLPPPLSAELRVCGVLSSHVGDEQRLRRLQNCLASAAQGPGLGPGLAAFFAVFSAGSEALASAAEKALEALRAALAPRPVRWLRQTERGSQFYDLRVLFREVLAKEPAGTWLLFSDDDDLWGPARVPIYYSVIDQHARKSGVTAVCATHKVRPKDRRKVAATQQEVGKHLKSGDAVICGGVHQEEEFFDFACPCESLGVFLEMCNEETLRHPFCDLRFTRFLQEYYEGGKAMYIPTDKAEHWVYYYATAYRVPEDRDTYEQFVAQGQASTVVRTISSDREEAQELCKQMGGKAGEKDLAEMTDFVAALRQNIEAIIIRQRLVGPLFMDTPRFPEVPMKVGEMKRIAVGQLQGQLFALRALEQGRHERTPKLQSASRWEIRDPLLCWPWSPRCMNASASQPSLCQVRDLQRSFHKKASQPYAWLYLENLRSPEFKVEWQLSGGRGVREALRQDDDVPGLTIQTVDDQKDLLMMDMSRTMTDDSLGSPSRRKNRHRGNSIALPKTHTLRIGGLGSEPMGYPLEVPHAELMASVAEAEARYVVRDHVAEYDLARMKVFFNRFALDGEVQKDRLWGGHRWTDA